MPQSDLKEIFRRISTIETQVGVLKQKTDGMDFRMKEVDITYIQVTLGEIKVEVASIKDQLAHQKDTNKKLFFWFLGVMVSIIAGFLTLSLSQAHVI